MAEYIERGGKLFPTPFSSEEHGDYRQGWNHCLRAIYQMPAADVVERKKGKWEHLSGDEWICNQCGFVLSTEGSWEHPLKDREKFYCEHCGADMREDTT